MGKCILCGGRLGELSFPFATRWDGKDYAYRKCTSCRSVIVDPIPDEKYLAAMYRQDAYHSEYYQPDDGGEGGETTLGDYLADLPKSGKLLDFGCGNGSFLRAAKGFGYDCTGVEMDAATRETATKLSGCPVVAMHEIPAAQRFDIIHLGDVLEHLPAPADTLRALAKHLADGGRFFVEGPIEEQASLVHWTASTIGRAKRILIPGRVASYPPYHLSRTNVRGQGRFFLSCGLKIDRMDVYETGWPYRVSAKGKGLAPRARDVIAGTAIGISKVMAALGGRMGNRFSAVLRSA